MVDAAAPRCPKCPGGLLRVVPGRSAPLDDPDAPLFCPTCAGVWIPPAAMATFPALDQAPFGVPEGTLPSPADRRTGVCPRGHGLLTRARAPLSDKGPDNFLERCAGCRGVWFDAGEVTRAQASDLWDHLDRLWDEGWQHSVREEQAAARVIRQLEERVGSTVMGHMHALVQALSGHPSRREALAWLQAQTEERSRSRL